MSRTQIFRPIEEVYAPADKRLAESTGINRTLAQAVLAAEPKTLKELLHERQTQELGTAAEPQKAAEDNVAARAEQLVQAQDRFKDAQQRLLRVYADRHNAKPGVAIDPGLYFRKPINTRSNRPQPVETQMRFEVSFDTSLARDEIAKLTAAIDEAIKRTVKPVVRASSERPGGLVGLPKKPIKEDAPANPCAEIPLPPNYGKPVQPGSEEGFRLYLARLGFNPQEVDAIQKEVKRSYAPAPGYKGRLHRRNPATTFPNFTAGDPRPGWNRQIPYDLADWLLDNVCTGLQYRDGCCTLTSVSGKLYVIEGAFQAVTWSNDLVINLACTPVLALRPAVRDLVLATRGWQVRQDEKATCERLLWNTAR